MTRPTDGARMLVVTTDLDLPEAHLLARLAAEGMALHVVCRPQAEYQQVLRAAGVPITSYAIRQRLDRPAQELLAALGAGTAFDIVHALRKRALSNVLFATRRSRVPITAYRGVPGSLSFWDPGSRISYLHPRVERIICVSHAVRDYLLTRRFLWHRLPPDKLVTIYKGHDPGWYAPAPRTALQEFGIPEGVPVVGCVATMVPRKGVDVLIRAVAALPPSCPAHLLLVGSVRDRAVTAAYERSACRHRIHFAGYRRDAAALAGAADVFVLPTVGAEGLPRAVLEAMAQGVVPVVTDVPGSREVVQDRLSGRVVPPGDPIALAEAIASTLSDPSRWAAYGRAARERVAREFAIEETVRRHQALFSELVRSR